MNAFLNKHQVDVDIIILTYDGLDLIRDCLLSVYAQSVKPKSIIVVDNGSSDGTTDYIQANYPDINLLIIDKNVGLPKAFNRALSLCSAEYVAWLNNDIILKEDWLENISSIIMQDEKLASCDSLVMYDNDRDTAWSQGASYNLLGAARFRGQGEKLSSIEMSKCSEVIATVGCAAIYKRQIFAEIGGLDETYFLGFEDVDWSLRASLMGYKHLNVSAAVVFHKVSQTVSIGSVQYVRNGQRNVTATFIKNTPFPLLLFLLPLHVSYQFLAFLFYLSKGRGVAWIMAKKDNIVLLKYYLQERSKLQRGRVISTLSYLRLISFNIGNDKIKLGFKK